MIGLWYAFGPDGPCLIESAAQWRESFPGQPVCICDDGRDPLPRNVINQIDPDHYERSDVRRNGNLIGPEASCMILDFQERMHIKYPGHAGGVKVDCDTLIFSDDWIDPDAPQCGFMQGALQFIWGHARWVRSDACTAAFDSILSRPISVLRRGNEDQIIGIELSCLYGPTCRILHATPDRCAFWHYRGGNYDQIHNASVVVFGNRAELPGKPCEKREVVALTMKKFRNERSARG